ncbi:vWA domain-containing protein [Niabella ginsengisoli]|uniref:VWA domain-containing protein n=1 Tax=Niabella ginsengisoli TaxID=522298 RepID=A0ABS9SF31_9BACT|nr:VWA domain-containing protein [Niabella ginsengisoli]MCH5596931.1 VWA domain-containing protein [Niabella ginsengisoli]
MASSINIDTPATFKTKFRHLPFILRMLAVTCLIMALARPQHQTQKSRSEGEGIDIVLCLDVSGSMGTEDVKPYRFVVAKEVAIEFVKNRPVDRIGLVIFAGESFTKCPITPDKNAVLNQLQSLKIMDGGYLETGTLIGEGLAMSVNRISKGTNKSRVIILLTDGKEDAPPTRIIDPEMAMEIAKANNVKVYCIGLGSATSTAEQMVKDVAGNVVRNYIDEALLTRIANSTGGRYYRATDKASLQAIYSQIDRLEKSKVEIIKYKEVQEMFIPLVLAALFWLLLEVVLKFTIFKKFP